MLTIDQIAVIRNLDRQIDNVVNDMVTAKYNGDTIALECLQADYDRLQESIAEIRRDAFADAEASAPVGWTEIEADDVIAPVDGMTQKRNDRIRELACLNRWIDARIVNLRSRERGTPEHNRMTQELAEQSLRRITLQEEIASIPVA